MVWLPGEFFVGLCVAEVGAKAPLGGLGARDRRGPRQDVTTGYDRLRPATTGYDRLRPATTGYDRLAGLVDALPASDGRWSVVLALYAVSSGAASPMAARPADGDGGVLVVQDLR